MGLIGKLTGSDAKKKAAKKARKDVAAREAAALGELTPEKIQALMQLFQSKYMQTLAPQMMGQQQRLQAQGAAAGTSRGGVFQSMAKGVPAVFANQATQMAIPQAMNTAQARASTIAGRDIIMDPGTSGLSDLFNTGVNLYGGFLQGSAGKWK